MQELMQLQYKGDRSYVQGGDIVDAVSEVLRRHYAGATDMEIAFRQMARSQLMVCDVLPAGQMAVATCSFHASGRRHKLYLVESGNPITLRQPFNEVEMVAPMRVHVADMSGTLAANPAFTDIEIWVAMTKRLHQRCFPEKTGKWLFVRGLFRRYEPHCGALVHRARIVSASSGRFTRTEIDAGQERVADIYFSHQ